MCNDEDILHQNRCTFKKMEYFNVSLRLSESESESERYLFDPYKTCIQSNNATILDQGTPIKTSLVAMTYDNNFFFISQAKNTS